MRLMNACITGCFVCVAMFSATTILADDDFVREGEGERREAKDALEGIPAPQFEVETILNLDSDTLNHEQFKGKVVLIDFWGTWCGPCRGAIPHLVELYEENKDKGLVVVGIHTTRGGEEMAAYVEEEGIPYPVAIDIEGKTVEAFHVDSYPDYYLIDRQGNLRFADLANREVDRAIEMLLAEDAESER